VKLRFRSTDHDCRDATLLEAGTYVSTCRIPGNLLNLSEYIIRGWAGVPGIRYFLEPVDFMKLSVEGVGNHGSTYSDYQRWPGVVCPKLDWQVLRQESYDDAKK
jgi:lipopolysaccharide transport system ATP-binding protein